MMTLTKRFWGDPPYLSQLSFALRFSVRCLPPLPWCLLVYAPVGCAIVDDGQYNENRLTGWVGSIGKTADRLVPYVSLLIVHQFTPFSGSNLRCFAIEFLLPFCRFSVFHALKFTFLSPVLHPSTVTKREHIDS